MLLFGKRQVSARQRLHLLEEELRSFLGSSRFSQVGAIVTDLDGTAVHEHEGRVVIPRRVELALGELVALGRPLMLNTLRFPLSVLRTFGREWYRISNAPLPAVTLNGSLLGHVVELPNGEHAFEESVAFTMSVEEIDRALEPVELLLQEDVRDVLVFYYPRDWRVGEAIWTPCPERILAVKNKYRSASAVTAVALDKLREELHREPTCMIFLLIDVPQDRKMAYQHTQRSHFFTQSGVDKLFGARVMAERLGVHLEHSVGAGDTEMDRFLSGVGCAIIVGHQELPFQGLSQTLRVPNSPALGDLLTALVELTREAA